MIGRLVLFALAAVAAATQPAQAAERPIVYAIVLDGLDGDAVDASTAPFLTALLSGEGGRATYYPESRSVMIAETNPNHTAMMTGAYGEDSGIPGNAFALYSPLENEDSCRATGPVNLAKLPSVTSGENANCPVAQTVFEAIKRQGNPDGLLTAAVLGKPKLGRIFAGKRFDPQTRDVDHLWAPCDGEPDDDEYCGDVQTNPVSGYAFDDGLVMDEVLRTIRDGVGKAKRRPDFTFVNLHQIDSAGHATTPGPAYQAAIMLADMELERLVEELRARGEWERTVLILLSDHSMDATLTKTNLTGVFTDAGVPEDSFVVVQNGSLDAVYLADRTSSGRFKLLEQLRAAALANSNVVEALYREPNPEDGGMAHTVDGMHPGWRAAGERSGDLIVTHAPGGAFTDPSETSNPLPGNHGGPHTSDNFFAVVSGGGLVRQQEIPGVAKPLFDDALVNPRQAENVDPAPTIMGLLGLSEPRDNAGRFLTEAFDLSAVPGAGRPAARPRFAVTRLRCIRGRRAVARVRFRSAGRHDLLVNRRRVLRNSRRRALRVKLRGPTRLRARRVAASGARGPAARRAVRVRC